MSSSVTTSGVCPPIKDATVRWNADPAKTRKTVPVQVFHDIPFIIIIIIIQYIINYLFGYVRRADINAFSSNWVTSKTVIKKRKRNLSVKN